MTGLRFHAWFVYNLFVFRLLFDILGLLFSDVLIFTSHCPLFSRPLDSALLHLAVDSRPIRTRLQQSSGKPELLFCSSGSARCLSKSLLYEVFKVQIIAKQIYLANGDGEIRTLDPLLARQVLSQLSYTPIHALGMLMGLSGLEPPTSRLSGVRSNRLSYKPICLQQLIYTIFC